MALWIALSSLAVASAQDSIQLLYREQIKHFFADQDVELHIDISSSETATAKVTWALRTEQRPLKQQTQQLNLRAEKPTTLVIKHRLPPLKDGVTFPIELWVGVSCIDSEQNGSLQETIFLHAKDKTFTSIERFKQLNLHLFDPTDETAHVLDAHELPYTRITNLETIREFNHGMILVGENTDWSDYGELGNILLDAAQRGVGVVCLAPAVSDGSLPLSSYEKDSRRWSFRRDEVLTALDKRFNVAWVPEKSSQLSGLRLEILGDQTVASTVEGKQGWPWFEIEFDQPHKKLVWCGFGIIRDWEQSPLPRQILTLTLFQHLTDRTPPGSAKPFPGYLPVTE
jgi:hypothetical protein